MILNNDILKQISQYSKDNREIEACGFVVEKDENIIFLPIVNIHPYNDLNFLISPKDYLSIKKEYKILYFFHSHPINEDFSEADLLYQKYHNLDMLLYVNGLNIFKEKKCKLI